MRVAPLPENEAQRLLALSKYKVLDTSFEQAYDELTQLASQICQTPIALISLIDTDRQWFKAKVGLEARETPRDWAFCAHALLQEDLLVVEDTLQDERFFDNPLVQNDPSIRFYAGAQIKNQEGYILGTVCAIDRIPRQLTDYQLNALKVLAKQVMTQLELRLAFEDLQNYTQQLHDSNQSKDKLFSVISHDLRAPMSGIFGLSELLIEDIETQPKEACKELAYEIHDASQQALSLLDNLLRWSLLERGKFDFQPMAMPLLVLIQKSIRLLASVATKKNIQIEVDCASHLFVVADKTMLASILQNLLANAIKFSNINSKVYVQATELKRQIHISVKDTGIGMSPAQQENLFKLDNNTTTVGTAGESGTGLGLMLCKQFLAIHQSDLQVHSVLGEGTTFSFYLKTIQT
ncbi:GAF domain-containing sensor histidine kinase [Agitococcus lubricus]|uniref:histidine kinase n=1 Tax=Agitococcus lubricus TaxID=1077255 RepID=A0A2T5J1U6_9GAMM|nr:HAMP domain-containing sensor histidine kinase [Agitococcus lubricus]PTQ90416.1 GAF sensor signal transduction histidine kinase [Agitococcus lubricus]